MSAPGSGGLRWRPVHTWLWRRPAYQVLAFTAVMAALGQMVSRLVWTPQLSGADAPITIRTAAAVLGGAAVAGLIPTRDPVAEVRAVRNIRLARQGVVGAVLCLGAAMFGVDPSAGWDWEAARTYVFVATVTLLIARSAGTLPAAAAFAAYLGACLFVGVPVDGHVRWWAVPVQPADGFSPGIAILAVTAAATVVVVFWNPSLPTNHRRGRIGR